MEDKECKNCKYWYPLAAYDAGICKCMPPSVIDETPWGVWPRTKENWYCHQWVDKEKQDAK